MNRASDGAGRRRTITAARAGRRAFPARALLTLSLTLSAIALGLGACGDDAVAPAPVCQQGTTLDLAATRVQRLDTSDELLDGVRVDYFSVRIAEPDTLAVEMSSARLDPFLILWASERRPPLAQAFDSTGAGVVRTARLQTFVEAGCYLVAATAWQPGHEGEYTIRADLLTKD